MSDLSNWALVATGVATLGVVAWQSIETKASAKAAERSVEAIGRQTALIKRQIDLGISKERARLFADMAPSELPCLNPGHQREMSSSPGFAPTCLESDDFRMSIRHEGESTAYNVQCSCEVMITALSSGRELFREVSNRTIGVVRRGDPEVIEELSVFPAITQELLDSLRDESTSLRFSGSVSYEDAFEPVPRHESRFSYVWRVAEEWIEYGDGEGGNADQSSWRRHPPEDNLMR